jgi:hypothetical protein
MGCLKGSILNCGRGGVSGAPQWINELPTYRLPRGVAHGAVLSQKRFGEAPNTVVILKCWLRLTKAYVAWHDWPTQRGQQLLVRKKRHRRTPPRYATHSEVFGGYAAATMRFSTAVKGLGNALACSSTSVTSAYVGAIGGSSGFMH